MSRAVKTVRARDRRDGDQGQNDPRKSHSALGSFRLPHPTALPAGSLDNRAQNFSFITLCSIVTEGKQYKMQGRDGGLLPDLLEGFRGDVIAQVAGA